MKKGYLSPDLEIIKVSVESGIAGSTEPEDAFANAGELNLIDEI